MYQKILVPTDGSPTAQRGLEEASKLAAILKAELEILYVVDSRIIYADFSGVANFGELIDAMKTSGEHILAQAKQTAEWHGVKVQTKIIESANSVVADLVLLEAREWSANLIVMGTHGRRGLSHLVMGSDAETVVRSSDVPVLLVRCPGTEATK
jgi:nucleotide-binding universal stress UspA family protein